jgi:hypothetical protein
VELLTEFTGQPADTDARAPLPGSLRIGTPVVSVVGMGGTGKTETALELVRAAQHSTDARSLRRNIAEIDSLFDQLSNQATQGTVELALPILFGENASPNLSPKGTPPTSPALTVPHAITVLCMPTKPPAPSVVPLVKAADHRWSSVIDLSLASGGSLFAVHLGSPCSERYSQHDASEAFTFAPELNTANSSLRLAWFSKYVLARLWQELIQLFSRMRMILRLRLIYVLGGLSQFSDAINFVLLLLAAARCYGRRSEPSDYTLPVLTPKSVVIGEAARLC